MYPTTTGTSGSQARPPGPRGAGQGARQDSAPSVAALRGVSVLAHLDSEALASIARCCRLRRVEGGATVVRHRDRTQDVYFVVSGCVRATLVSRSGKEVSFRDLGPGAIAGHLSALDGGGRSADLVALEESTLAVLSGDDLWSIIRRHPLVAEAIIVELAGAVRALSDRVVEFSTLGVKNRIHAELLRLVHEQADPGPGAVEGEVLLSPAPRHADIASRVSTHREAVSRELAELGRKGLLERVPGGLAVRDVPRLRRLVEQVKGA